MSETQTRIIYGEIKEKYLSVYYTLGVSEWLSHIRIDMVIEYLNYPDAIF
jgi:hypothetical protein